MMPGRPKVYSKRTSMTHVRIDPDLLERVDAQCSLNVIGRNKFIEIALKRLLAEVEEED